jgi:hypothetical protein
MCGRARNTRTRRDSALPPRGLSPSARQTGPSGAGRRLVVATATPSPEAVRRGTRS